MAWNLSFNRLTLVAAAILITIGALAATALARPAGNLREPSRASLRHAKDPKAARSRRLHRRTPRRHHARHHASHRRSRRSFHRADRAAAPVLSLEHGTLHWTAAGRSRQYIEARTTPTGTTYVHVARTTDSPPAVPGVPVTYRVRPSHGSAAWSNQVTVSYPSRVQAAAKLVSTQSSKPVREKRKPAETESEREARERAEREARERAELEAKEKAEREAKEKAEQVLPTGPAVNAIPSGPPAPSSGWRVAYADAFAARIGSGSGEDNTWKVGERDQGCCGNPNEIAIERPSQVSITPEGLKLTCEHISTPVNGHSYSCGGISGGGAPRPPLLYYKGETMAIEWRGKLPPNMGFADPGVWQYGGTGNAEFDYPEMFGWGSRFANNGYQSTGSGWVWYFGADMYKGEYAAGWAPSEPENKEHIWTTYIHPTSSGRYSFSLYVDGALIKLGNAGAGCYSLSCAVSDSPEVTPDPSVNAHLVITYALRKAESSAGKSNEASATGFPNAMTIRSEAVYIDAAHAGSGAVTNEGIAPGTTVK